MSVLAQGKASGKAILLGEHFVLPWTDGEGATRPGSRALALPLPGLLTEVSLRPSYEFGCQLDLLGHPQQERHADLVPRMEAAVRRAAELCGWDLKDEPLSVHSWSNLLLSRGMGSSASFSVAMARAFCSLKPDGPAQHVRKVAQEIENLFHGKSSGLDTSVSFHERPILFQSGDHFEPFTLRAVDLVVVDSGPRENSSVLIGEILNLRVHQSTLWSDLTAQVDSLASGCFQEIQNPAGSGVVAEILAQAQSILGKIGLTTPKGQELLSLGLRLGALSGKISGAGGGGILLFATEPGGGGAALARRMSEAGAHVLKWVEAEA